MEEKVNKEEKKKWSVKEEDNMKQLIEEEADMKEIYHKFSRRSKQ
jgi:hypothetical protein